MKFWKLPILNKSLIFGGGGGGGAIFHTLQHAEVESQVF